MSRDFIVFESNDLLSARHKIESNNLALALAWRPNIVDIENLKDCLLPWSLKYYETVSLWECEDRKLDSWLLKQLQKLPNLKNLFAYEKELTFNNTFSKFILTGGYEGRLRELHFHGGEANSLNAARLSRVVEENHALSVLSLETGTNSSRSTVLLMLGVLRRRKRLTALSLNLRQFEQITDFQPTLLICSKVIEARRVTDGMGIPLPAQIDILDVKFIVGAAAKSKSAPTRLGIDTNRLNSFPSINQLLSLARSKEVVAIS